MATAELSRLDTFAESVSTVGLHLAPGPEDWQELAWRPSGAKSLSERWLQAGEPHKPRARRRR